MITKYNNLTLITARSGSKRIKNKNLYKIKGMPLIAWTIIEALKSKYISEVIVSTDDETIADVSEKYGAKIFFLRPKNLSKDTSKSISAIMHAIETLKKEKKYYEHLILLQPTSPLRKTFHIDEAIQIYNSNKEKCLVSISKVSISSQIKNLIVHDVNSKNYINFRNISLDKNRNYSKYRINGALYITEIESMIQKNSIILNDDCLAYIMDEKYSIDIDTYEDLKYLKKSI